MPPALALRDAIKALLKADPALAALIEERVHDRVPSMRDGLQFPFVAFGPMRLERHETGCDPARPAKIRLYTASTEYERDQAWTVAHLVAAAIEGAEPAIAGPYALATALRVGLMGDALETAQPRDVFIDVGCTLYLAD